jgi:hypothetical protein
MPPLTAPNHTVTVKSMDVLSGRPDVAALATSLRLRANGPAMSTLPGSILTEDKTPSRCLMTA